VCAGCGAAYERVNGVWDLIPKGERARVDGFLKEYEAVREAEGRGVKAATELLRLPWVDVRHARAWEWRIRAASFRVFVQTAGLASRTRAARLVDLGAGVGWLALRAQGAGHSPLAVDLSAHERHGLGALRGAFPHVPAVRASFERLPLGGASADVALFNASLHYAPDPEAALGEALRVLEPSGCVAIVDTPFYDDAAAGEKMVEERKALFRERYGFASDAHGGREFLTWSDLDAWADGFGLRWQVVRPRYGVRYALRPLGALLRRRRPPSRFAVVVGRRV
jgi:SAM-dependent methyltransferase